MFYYEKQKTKTEKQNSYDNSYYNIFYNPSLLSTIIFKLFWLNLNRDVVQIISGEKLEAFSMFLLYST